MKAVVLSSIESVSLIGLKPISSSLGFSPIIFSVCGLGAYPNTITAKERACLSSEDDFLVIPLE